jgi:hypothetical protein
MSDSATLSARQHQPSAEHVWPVVLSNIVLGMPAYFISFLFAYGFRDVVGVTEHVTFLVLITIFAVTSGLASMIIPVSRPPGASASRRAAFVVQLSLALNSAVVGVGSIVSALHKEENSVSADFSTATDVLVAAALLGLAAVLATTALRGRQRKA